MGSKSTFGVAGGPAGVVWHGAPSSAVPDEWARHVRAERRKFEDALDEALDADRHVAIVLVDNGMVRLALRLAEAMPQLEDRVRQLVRPADRVGLVGEDQVGVLLVDTSDAEVAALAERLATVFDEPLVFDTGERQRMHGTVVWVSGGGDLLWRALYENAAAVTREHHLVFTEGVFGMPGMNAAQSLDALGAIEWAFREPLGMEAVHLDVPVLRPVVGRPVPPSRPATGEVPIRLDGTNAGWFRWWSAPGQISPDHPIFYTALSAAFSETLQRLVHGEALAQAAAHDPLTGLLNRRGLYAAVRGLDGPFAVALVDIDDFKAVNTELGLAGGDEVLGAVAKVLSDGRDSDIVARWGGEEFLLALPGATTDEAAGRLRRMLADTEQSVVIEQRGITFSCGIAGGDSTSDFDGVVAVADSRLQSAKDAGKARVHVA